MVTLTKEKVTITDRIDTDKENFFLVGFRDSPPYSPVLIAMKFVALPGQSDNTTINGISYSHDLSKADEPTTTDTPGIEERLIGQMQSLMLDGRLTHRELQVLNHVATGAANKEIARELNISLQTVKSYVSSIMCKLDAKNRAHAVTLAARQGWISL